MNDPSNGPSSADSASRRTSWLLVLLTALLAAAPYGIALFHGFVWDDVFVVVENPHIRSARWIPRIFADARTYASGLFFPTYRPLVTLGYMADHGLGGLNPVLFHLHNVALHALNTALAAGILLRLLRLSGSSAEGRLPLVVSCVAALVWALHPVQTEVVAWVKSRDELQCALFVFIAFLVFLDGVRRSRISPVRAASIALILLLALLSKETAAAFLLALPLCWWLLPRARVRGFAGLCGLCAGSLAVYLLLRWFALGQIRQTGYLAGGFWPQMLTMVRVAVRYLRLAVAPGDQTSDYSGFFEIQRSPFAMPVLFSGVLLVAVLAAAFAARVRQPLVSLGILWFGAFLLPVSNIIPTMQFLAERFLYIPLLGLGMLVAALMSAFLSAGMSPKEIIRRRRLAGVLAAVVLAAELAATSLRLPVWKDDLSLFADAYAHAPSSRRITWQYAVALFNAGHFERALPLYRDLARDMPDTARDQISTEAVTGYGICLMMTGSLEEGVRQTRRAMGMVPDSAAPLRHLAFYHERKGDLKAALEANREALKRAPDDSRIAAKVAEITARIEQTTTPH